MDSTPEEKQNNRVQEKRSGGGVGRGINAINNLAGGTRVAAQTAIRGLGALLLSPTGLVVGVVAVVFIIVLVITLSFGAPDISAPTEAIITPTPAP